MTDLFSFFNKTTYSFEGKKDDETVVLFLHRHWFTIVSKIVTLVAGALLPFIVIGVFGRAISSMGLLPLFGAIWAAYYMGIWYMLFYALTMYTLDTWIVTDTRIINSVQHGFFNRNISELSLDRVQDVSVEVAGAIPTMLNYGILKVQTAGIEHHFRFEQISDPQDVKDKIMQVVAQHKYRSPAVDEEQRHMQDYQ